MENRIYIAWLLFRVRRFHLRFRAAAARASSNAIGQRRPFLHRATLSCPKCLTTPKYVRAPSPPSFPFFTRAREKKSLTLCAIAVPFSVCIFSPLSFMPRALPPWPFFTIFLCAPPRASLFKTLFSPLLYVFFLPSSPRARASARGPRHAYVFVCELSPVWVRARRSARGTRHECPLDSAWLAYIGAHMERGCVFVYSSWQLGEKKYFTFSIISVSDRIYHSLCLLILCYFISDRLFIVSFLQYFIVINICTMYICHFIEHANSLFNQWENVCNAHNFQNINKKFSQNLVKDSYS